MTPPTQPVTLARVTGASLSPIWYQKALTWITTMGNYINRSYGKLATKIAELNGGGLFNPAMVLTKAMTGVTISAAPEFLHRLRNPEWQGHALHNLDGTTWTTFTTTTTPNTQPQQPWETDKVIIAQPPLTQLTRMNYGGIFTAPVFNINSTIQHTHAGEADATSHGSSYNSNDVPTSQNSSVHDYSEQNSNYANPRLLDSSPRRLRY